MRLSCQQRSAGHRVLTTSLRVYVSQGRASAVQLAQSFGVATVRILTADAAMKFMRTIGAVSRRVAIHATAGSELTPLPSAQLDICRLWPAGQMESDSMSDSMSATQPPPQDAGLLTIRRPRGEGRAGRRLLGRLARILPRRLRRRRDDRGGPLGPLAHVVAEILPGRLLERSHAAILHRRVGIAQGQGQRPDGPRILLNVPQRAGGGQADVDVRLDRARPGLDRTGRRFLGATLLQRGKRSSRI